MQLPSNYMVAYILAQVILIISNTQPEGCHRTTDVFIQDDWSEVSTTFALISLTFYVSFLMILDWVYSPESTFLPVARHRHPGRCLMFSALSEIKVVLLGAEFSLLTRSASAAPRGPVSRIPSPRHGLCLDGCRIAPPWAQQWYLGKSQLALCAHISVIVWHEKGDLGKIASRTYTLLVLLWLPPNAGWE